MDSPTIDNAEIRLYRKTVVNRCSYGACCSQQTLHEPLTIPAFSPNSANAARCRYFVILLLTESSPQQTGCYVRIRVLAKAASVVALVLAVLIGWLWYAFFGHRHVTAQSRPADFRGTADALQSTNIPLILAPLIIFTG
jgi:hypothetical protein